MFDLNEHVRSWREALLQREAFGADDVDELESHLHEDVAGLTAKGLSEGEAFFVAVRRLGQADELDTEFHKVNGASIWGRRLQWMFVGCLVFVLAGRLIPAVAGLITLGAVVWGIRGVTLVSVYAFVCVLGISYLVYLAARIACCGAGRAQTLAHRLRAWAGTRRGFVVLLILPSLLVAGIQALEIASVAVFVSFLTVSEFGEFSVGRLYLGAARGMLLPVVLVAAILCIERIRRNPKLDTA